jgi:hypothetical protein
MSQMMHKINVQKSKLSSVTWAKGIFVFEKILIRQEAFKDPHWITDRGSSKRYSAASFLQESSVYLKTLHF